MLGGSPERRSGREDRGSVVCKESAFTGLFEPFVQIALAEPGWNCVELAAGHSPMVTEPVALSKPLIKDPPMQPIAELA